MRRSRNPLRDNLPYGYVKEAQKIVEANPTSISEVANGKHKNEKIKSALAWVAMENIMTKIFAL